MLGLKSLALLSVALMLSCCKTGTVIQNDYCLHATPIYISGEDVLTDQTARQTLTHNKTWASMCMVVVTPL